MIFHVYFETCRWYCVLCRSEIQIDSVAKSCSKARSFFPSLSLFLSVSLVAHQQLTKWNKPSYNYQHEYDTFFPLSPPKNAVDNDLLAEDHPPIAEIKCKQHRIMNQFFFAFAILQPEKTSLIDAKQRIICLYIERTKETKDKKNWNLCLAMCMWNQTPAQCDEP